MGQETKPELDSETKDAPKIVEAPVAPVVAEPAPVQSLADASDHKEGSNLKNLFDQMMESNDDLASYSTFTPP